MQITGKKHRALAKRQLEFVEGQITQLRAEQEAAMAGYQRSESFLARQADEIRSAITAYDAPKGEV